MDNLRIANAITKALMPDRYGCAEGTINDAMELFSVRQKVLDVLNANGFSAWQPLTTAPKTGEVLILFARYEHATAFIPMFGFWHDTYGWIAQSTRVEKIVGKYWMRRMAFPKEA